MAKILINYPSRSRPHKFIKILSSYIGKASGNHEITVLLKVDHDDPTMNNEKIFQYARGLKDRSGKKVPVGVRVLSDCTGKIDAINRGVSEYTFDIVISIADDMDVIEDNWDETLVKEFNGDYSICLNYDADPRLEDYRTLVVLPIIGKDLYQQFGYIYHPAYKSEYCDNEQTEVFTSLGKLRHVKRDHKLFHHDWAGNQDSLMKRNITIGQSVDSKTFKERKALKFPKMHFSNNTFVEVKK